MNVRKAELDNGLVVATEVMPHVRSVSLGVWVKGGSRQEHDCATGLAHFIEHLLFKGTRSRSAAEIAASIDSVGAQLDAFTDKEYVGFYAKVLDEHLPRAFELLADIVLHPTFPAAEIERERNVIFEEISMVEDSPQELIQEVFMERFWRGHPLGRPIAGTRESVARIGRRDVKRFFRANYTAACTIVSVAGNIRHGAVQDLARRHFAELAKGEPAAPGAPPTVRGARDIRRKRHLEQTHICLGTIAPSATDDARYAAHVLCTVLGGGLSSRLFQKIREQRGLVYSIHSSLNLYHDAGTLVIDSAMGQKNAARVVELVCREIRALKDKLIPAGELTRAKDNLKGSLLLGLESSTSRMTYLAHQEIYHGRFVEPREILRGIERIGSRDVRRLANEIFDPGYLTLTSLGSGSNRELRTVELKV